MKRAIPFPLPCLVLCCSHAQVTTLPVSADTVVTATFDLTKWSTFPQIPDSAKGHNGELLAAPNSPPCPLPVRADTATWLKGRTRFSSQYLRGISLWLPPDFRPYPYRDTMPPPEDTTRYWGHILGSWWRLSRSGATSMEEMAIWIGPHQGYPESSIGGAQSSRCPSLSVASIHRSARFLLRCSRCSLEVPA